MGLKTFLRHLCYSYSCCYFTIGIFYREASPIFAYFHLSVLTAMNIYICMYGIFDIDRLIDISDRFDPPSLEDILIYITV